MVQPCKRVLKLSKAVKANLDSKTQRGATLKPNLDSKTQRGATLKPNPDSKTQRGATHTLTLNGQNLT